MFENYLIIVVLIICVLYFITIPLKHGGTWIVKRVTVMPDGYEDKILPALARVLSLNWYTYLMLLMMWYLLFFTEIGEDIIDMYLVNLTELSIGGRAMSYFFLFGTTFVMSLSIWILPFFLYNPSRVAEIKANAVRFYVGSKMLAFVAMLPFLLVTNAFFSFSYGDEFSFIKILLVNSVSFIIFLLLTFVFKRLQKVPIVDGLFNPYKKWITNYYLFIIFRILFWVVLLCILFSVPSLPEDRLKYAVSLFMFVASVIVFRLLFYSDHSAKMSEAKISELVEDMLTKKNRKDSRKLYRWLIWPLITVTLYYYLVPSLVKTNSLYILLTVFSFFIIYLDYWRNVMTNGSRLAKTVAFTATVLFLALPFIPTKDQFRIQLGDAPAGMGLMSLDSAVDTRIDSINLNGSTSNIYIVCAMGGGSRAGYVTAGVLNAIDAIDSAFYDNTLCYSTVSGGSVGMYSYIKGKEGGYLRNDPSYLDKLFKANYNSSGVYGLLVGDAIETMMGKIASVPKSWVSREAPGTGYFDRNYRIRQEYDYVYRDAISKNPDASYRKRTFYPWFDGEPYTPDSFKTYHYRKNGGIPIHLINTFEVNSGQRTVLCPFTAGASFFPNAMMPLEDPSFDSNITRKDMRYREAVNLSELFPIVSAASHIGNQKYAQFVDGGYYENYGLATALDMVFYLKFKRPEDFKRLKILLIKNSQQESKDFERQIQFLAPLIGAKNSPFTGHANHLLAETRRVLDSSNFYTIVFDGEKKKVPLTRALTDRHINTMKSFFQSLGQDTHLLSFLKTASRKDSTVKDTIQAK